MNVVLNAASQKFGRYQLLEFLGSGGMSDVFRAVHTGLHKPVALKLLRSSLRHDAATMERFLREGECAARVSHPNIVEVTDVGTEDGVPYLVMELLEGETLEQKLTREGPLTLKSAIDLLLPIFDGVAAIHDAGVLHRDIKPSNILLARTRDGNLVPKLVDFGIATVEERRSITGALGPLGTPHYMSPEQARGERGIDERSDQYALASVLFEMITGRTPFDGDEPSTVLSRVAQGRFPRACAVQRGLPLAIDDVLSRATALDPAQRFDSVAEFARALLPLAGQRSRRFWSSRAGRVERGAWRVEGDPHETMRISAGGARPSKPVLARSSLAPTTTPRTLVAVSGLAALIVLLGFVLGLGPLRSIHFSHTLKRLSVTTLAQVAAQRAEASLDLSVKRPLAITPSHAQVLLDGVALGKGPLAVPVFGDQRVHELRIAAPGYVTRVELFRGTIADGRIALEAVR